MLNKNRTITHLTIVFATALLIGLFSGGCKEEPANTADPVESQPEATAKTAQEEAPKASEPLVVEPLEPEAVESAVESVVEGATSAAESQAQIAKIIAGARTWGPATEAWNGKPAPDFEMTALDGTTRKLSEYKGKKVLLVFWATWCPPCRAEIPDLNELRGKADPEKVAILGVAGQSPGRPPDTLEKVKPFAEAMEISYDVFIENGELPEPFGVGRIFTTTGIPGAFLIDAEGIIRLQTVGIVPLEDIEGLLEAI